MRGEVLSPKPPGCVLGVLLRRAFDQSMWRPLVSHSAFSAFEKYQGM